MSKKEKTTIGLKRKNNYRGNISKIDKYIELKEYITKNLKLGWSPEQISGRIKKIILEIR